MGAQNFLIKPVRIPQCRALIAFMKKRKEITQDKTEQKGLARYEMLRFLGNGAAGRVDLMRNKSTGEQCAVKTIQLQYLSDKDKLSAESEVEFLKVITGPTII